MIRFHWKASLLAVCLVLGLAGPAVAADIYYENHTKTVGVGLVTEIKVNAQVGFVKQPDGDGLRFSMEHITILSGCSHLESDGHGKWNGGTISVYSHYGVRLRTVSFGSGQSCNDYANAIIDGPDQGYADVVMRLKLRVDGGIPDKWVEWHFRAEWGCCASKTAPVPPALAGGLAGRHAGDTPASLIGAALAGAVGRAR